MFFQAEVSFFNHLPGPKSLNVQDVESCIIDSELVAYDQVNKKILPFQVLTTRGRKNINVEDIKARCRWVTVRFCLKMRDTQNVQVPQVP